nr:shikimate dehydrogenase [uncultured bacterium]
MLDGQLDSYRDFFGLKRSTTNSDDEQRR